MATVDQLITDVQSWTSTNSTVLPTATCLEFVNIAVRRLQRVRAYQAEIASVLLDVGTSGTVPIPRDYIAEKGVWQKTNASDPAQALLSVQRTLKMTWVEGVDSTTTRDAIYPSVASPAADAIRSVSGYAYYIWNGELTIVPTPSATITLQFDYVRRLPELVAGTAHESEFLRLYADVVRDGALVEAYRYLHQWDVSLAYEQLFAAKVKEATLEDEAPTAAGATRPTKGR